MNVLSITIVKGFGTDTVFLKTDLPSACWPFEPTGQTLKFEVVQNDGLEYVRKHFQIEPTIVGRS